MDPDPGPSPSLTLRGPNRTARAFLALATPSPSPFTASPSASASAGEQLLRRSGVAYTIVRPGRLVDGPFGAAPPLVGQTNRHLHKGAQSTRAAT